MTEVERMFIAGVPSNQAALSRRDASSITYAASCFLRQSSRADVLSRRAASTSAHAFCTCFFQNMLVTII